MRSRAAPLQMRWMLFANLHEKSALLHKIAWLLRLVSPVNRLEMGFTDWRHRSHAYGDHEMIAEFFKRNGYDVWTVHIANLYEAIDFINEAGLMTWLVQVLVVRMGLKAFMNIILPNNTCSFMGIHRLIILCIISKVCKQFSMASEHINRIQQILGQFFHNFSRRL